MKSIVTFNFIQVTLTNLKKEMPGVVLPLLPRMILEQIVGTTSKLFQSRLVICLLQCCIFSSSWNMHGSTRNGGFCYCGGRVRIWIFLWNYYRTRL